MKKIMFDDRYGLTQAVLEGKKTMTRRVIKGDYVVVVHLEHEGSFIGKTANGDSVILPQPAYNVGDELAIAQSYSNLREVLAKRDFKRTDALYDKFYRAMQMGEAHDGMPGWGNKMFVRADLMPHRIRNTGINVERLQNISEEDCLKEGVEKWIDCYIVPGIMENRGKNNVCFDSPREAFAALIDRICGRDTWQRNPWVYVYTLELIK